MKNFTDKRIKVQDRVPEVGDLIGFPFMNPIIVLRVEPYQGDRGQVLTFAHKVLILDIKTQRKGTTGFWQEDKYELLGEAGGTSETT